MNINEGTPLRQLLIKQGCFPIFSRFFRCLESYLGVHVHFFHITDETNPKTREKKYSS